MDFNIDFQEFEIIMGKKIKSFSNGWSDIDYTTPDKKKHSIRKEIVVSRYVDYITEKLGKTLVIELKYNKKFYSYSCNIRVKNSGISVHLGGRGKNDSLLTGLSGIIRMHDKKYVKNKYKIKA